MESNAGLVDLQVNGWAGVDFSAPDLTDEGIVSVIRAQLAAGTAAFLPTIITSPLEVYERNLALLARVLERAEFRSSSPGIHVEGPFISAIPGAVGAHNAAWTCDPAPSLLERMQSWAGGKIRLLTLAPERAGSGALISRARELGMLVSLGHTLATQAEMADAAAQGATLLTHLGNGLPPELPKFANPLWAGLTTPALTAMFIGDGHHVPLPILLALLRAKGIPNSLLVSDAAPVAGFPPGEYRTLGNRAVLTPEGRLYNPDKGNLVGSSYSLLRCVNTLAADRSLSREALTWLGRDHAAQLLGLDVSALPRLLAWDPDRHSFSSSATE